MFRGRHGSEKSPWNWTDVSNVAGVDGVNELSLWVVMMLFCLIYVIVLVTKSECLLLRGFLHVDLMQIYDWGRHVSCMNSLHSNYRSHVLSPSKMCIARGCCAAVGENIGETSVKSQSLFNLTAVMRTILTTENLSAFQKLYRKGILWIKQSAMVFLLPRHFPRKQILDYSKVSMDGKNSRQYQ